MHYFLVNIFSSNVYCGFFPVNLLLHLYVNARLCSAPLVQKGRDSSPVTSDACAGETQFGLSLVSAERNGWSWNIMTLNKSCYYLLR